MTYSLRPCTEADYPAIISVMNAARPEFVMTMEFFLAWEQRNDPRCHYGRWVAETPSGQIVGLGEYLQRSDQYDPGRFYIRLHIFPEWHGTGLRETLYETVMRELEALSPKVVRVSAYEERPGEVEFWRNKGFVEFMRSGDAWIDLTTFDFDRYTDSERDFTEAGFIIHPITELVEDPERDEKLCDLFNIVIRDVPPRGEKGRLDRETFVRLRLAPPDVLHDLYFVALSPEGEYVGTAQLRIAPDGNPQALSTGLTGVHPEWRRRGIGLALKLRSLREAQARGYTKVCTSNASDNEPILELNRQMGYIRSPWHIHYLKTWEGTAE